MIRVVSVSSIRSCSMLRRKVVYTPMKLSICGRGSLFYSPSRLVIKSFFSSNPDLGEKEKASLQNIPSVPVETAKPNKLARLNSALKSGVVAVRDMIMNPRTTWQSIKEVAHHYWMGSKLLWSEMKLTKEILGRVVRGHEMTRRERRQLIRTTMDMFRLVPFAVFVIVPFMEFLLPFALKMFPNMLPSTFQDTVREEENMKKELKMRLAVAKFFQDTMQEMANRKTKGAAGPDSPGAQDLLDFVESAQKGRPISNEVVIRMAKYFEDELTLPNIARPQLASMCRYMGINPYGSDSFLRFQIRNKIRAIKEDDRRILWEGVDSLNTLELREACRERGMRSSGLTQFNLKSQLVEWLELSTQKSIPISLLIMSRAFNLTTATAEPEEVLKSSMSALDPDTINEIVLASAKGLESTSVAMRQRQLDSLKFQKEMIAEEIGKVDIKKKTESKSASTSTPIDMLPSSTNPLALTATSMDPAVPTSINSNGTCAIASEAMKRSFELTARELQVLSDLSRRLAGDKVDFQTLQTTVEALLIITQQQVPSSTTIAAYSTTVTQGMTIASQASISSSSQPRPSQKATLNDETAARSITRLQSILNSLLQKLQVPTSVVDTNGHNPNSGNKIGRLGTLDQDGDGNVSAQELRDIIVRLMKRSFTIQEAMSMVEMLDSDQDGKISITELLQYIDHQKESYIMKGDK